MKISQKTINRIRLFSIVIFCSMIGGGAYSYFITLNRNAVYYIIAGSLVGLIGSSLSLIFEEFITQTNFFRKKLTVSIHFIFRVLFYLTVFGFLIFCLMFISEGSFSINSVFNVIKDTRFFRSIIFSLLISMLITFFMEMVRLVGRNSLLNFFIGRYHRPRVENRIIMFLDINDSTTIAEKIGHIKFHSFLNDFFYDISPIIENHKGEIYKYVGDEIIVTWKFKTGIRKSKFVNCIKEIYNLIEKKKVYYNSKYGYVPYFKSGFHSGEVVIGEMGDVKKEIVYLGDVVNTAARIQGKCKYFNKYVLFSKDTVSILNDKSVKFEDLGEISLKGKEEMISLYSI